MNQLGGRTEGKELKTHNCQCFDATCNYNMLTTQYNPLSAGTTKSV